MEIEALIDLWAGKQEETTKAVKGLHRHDPLWRNLGTGNTPSALATQTIIVPYRPAAGRMWFVHRAGILGADGHTAAAGIADIYCGPGQEADASAQIYSGLTIPSIIVEGRFHNPVLPNEQVYCICYNLAANQQLQFVIGVEEYPLEAHTGTEI
jgi:hypothetical protein